MPGMTYNPAQVALGGGPGPYLWGAGKPKSSPIISKGPMSSGPIGAGTPAPTVPVPTAPAPAPPTQGTLGPESIRATGSGPFDSAYRQNLATYAGGQFQRPSGGMSFNPTDPNTFPGQPTGGGNAPLPGLPTSLIDTALSGGGFSWTPPAADTSGAPGDAPMQTLQDWMDQFLQSGGRKPLL